MSDIISLLNMEGNQCLNYYDHLYFITEDNIKSIYDEIIEVEHHFFHNSMC